MKLPSLRLPVERSKTIVKLKLINKSTERVLSTSAGRALFTWRQDKQCAARGQRHDIKVNVSSLAGWQMVRLTPSQPIKGDIMLTSFVQLNASHTVSANLMCGNEMVPQKTLLSYQISHLEDFGEISILSGVGLNHDSNWIETLLSLPLSVGANFIRSNSKFLLSCFASSANDTARSQRKIFSLTEKSESRVAINLNNFASASGAESFTRGLRTMNHRQREQSKKEIAPQTSFWWIILFNILRF